MYIYAHYVYIRVGLYYYITIILFLHSSTINHRHGLSSFELLSQKFLKSPVRRATSNAGTQYQFPFHNFRPTVIVSKRVDPKSDLSRMEIDLGISNDRRLLDIVFKCRPIIVYGYFGTNQYKSWCKYCLLAQGKRGPSNQANNFPTINTFVDKYTFYVRKSRLTHQNRLIIVGAINKLLAVVLKCVLCRNRDGF